MTYRLSDHTTADDARRYRAQDEVSAAWALEPLARLRHFLVSQKLWSGSAGRRNPAGRQSGRSQRRRRRLPGHAAARPDHLFDYLYAELPADLAAQRQQLLTERGLA